MNIKISIKQCDCEPTLITKKQISEVEFKKKNMLYAPPTKDKKILEKTKTPSLQSHNRVESQNRTHQSKQEEAEKKLLKDMSEITKNQITMDMVQNTNSILQRQNQIIESNQKAIHHMLISNQSNNIRPVQQQKNLEMRRVFEETADKIAKQMKEIKKMRDEIMEYGESIKRTSGDWKSSSKGNQQIGQMNSNLKSLVQISKNHIEGLQNLEGIKSLQNFNIEAYSQAINSLKKQIAQYQNQSETIQRELKLRSAKLQQLQISPSFDQQLLQPYEQYLRKKADNVDLHNIREKVFERLGVFDYGRFESDCSEITNEIKNQMNEFFIICKQFRVNVPDISIDKKQLKMLDLKLPSVLDQYKASTGIAFSQKSLEQDQNNIAREASQKNKIAKETSKSFKETSKTFKYKSMENQQKLLVSKQNQQNEIYTKPVDYSKSTKLTRVDENQYKTVLQTVQQQRKKQVVRNIKKPDQQDTDFQKYLENRTKEELAAIYEEKRKKLQQMEKQLYQVAKEEPKFQLTLNVRNNLSKQPKPKSENQNQKQQSEQYDEDFEGQSEPKHKPEKKPTSPEKNKEKQTIKNIGTEVLRQKLKNLFAKTPTLPEQLHQNKLINQNPQPVQPNQISSIAEGFVNMINNTLAQVNSQLTESIQKKIQNRSLSREKKGEVQRRSPNKITVPKLQEFRAPPVFNMEMIYEPGRRQTSKKEEKKIVAKDYDYLRISEDHNELQISSISNDD